MDHSVISDEDSMPDTQNVEVVRALWNGAEVLNQQISNGTLPLFTLQQQLRILATKLTVLHENVTMETTNETCNNRLQLPFRPIAPTPKGKLIGIIESLKRASLGGSSCETAEFKQSVEVDCVAIDTDKSTHVQEISSNSENNNVMLIVPPPPALPCALILDQSLVQSLRAPPKYTPTRPLKALFWKRLQYTSLELRETEVVWKSISEPDLLDGERFEQLFARKVTKTNDSLSYTGTVVRQHSSRQPIRLLDGHRSQVLGILLNSLHIEISEVERAVMNFDLQTCELETLQTIADVLPTSEELVTIKNHLHGNPNAPLDKPEMFLNQLSEIPQFTDRLTCLLFSRSFAESADTVQTKLTTMKKICDMLYHSQGVSNVLGVILAFGNVMNSENKVRGQADGFQLDILCKLKDVKSADNSTNLLLYIVQYWVQHYDQHAGTIAAMFPLPDPSNLFAASQIKFDKLNADLEELTQQMGVAKSHLDEVLISSPQQHIQPFRSRMELSLKQAESMLECLKAQLTSVRSDFTRCVKYYCVPPTNSGRDDVSPEDFFGLWCSFVKDFHEIWKSEQRQAAKKRQKEQQERRIANAPVKPVSNTSLKWRIQMKRNNTN